MPAAIMTFDRTHRRLWLGPADLLPTPFTIIANRPMHLAESPGKRAISPSTSVIRMYCWRWSRRTSFDPSHTYRLWLDRCWSARCGLCELTIRLLNSVKTRRPRRVSPRGR